MGAAASTRGPEPTFSVAELRQQLDSLPDDGKGNVTARQLLSLFPTLDPSAIETIVGSAVGATTLPTTSYKHSVPTTAPHKHKGMARGTSSRHTTQAIKSAVQAGDWEKVATHLGEVFTEFDTDANGVLFWDEFESLMLSLELNWVDGDNGWEEIKQLWAKFDVNNDQRVQWHEYLTPLSVFLHEHLNLGGGRAVDVDPEMTTAVKRACAEGQWPIVADLLSKLIVTVQGSRPASDASGGAITTSGVLQWCEFFHIMRALDLNLEEEGIRAMFDAFDTNRDQVLTEAELIGPLEEYLHKWVNLGLGQLKARTKQEQQGAVR